MTPPLKTVRSAPRLVTATPRPLLERFRRKRATPPGRQRLADDSSHQLHCDEVLRLLDVDPCTGLSEQEAGRRREKYGWNRVTPRPPMPGWQRFALQFHQPLSYLLLAAVVVTAFLGEWVDAAVIFRCRLD
jgi:magnesium-transporting ATPase (P-type)